MSAKVIALLNSHIEGDNEQFLSLALQLAAQEAREGRIEQAEKVKALVQKARDRQRQPKLSSAQGPIPLARPRADLDGIVASSYPRTGLSGMVLSDDVASRLANVVRQQNQRATLRDNGQIPATHLLLVGPPGTGKTMTAEALAGELHLPLFRVRLESVFSRFFGETSAKLGLLFEQIAQMRGVYLLDEFDALGARRGEGNDVGEIRRVLNAILGLMELPNSTDSLVIAATNCAEMLDEALARRFDEVIEYTLPDTNAAKAIVVARLGKFQIPKRALTKLAPDMDGLSPAELCRAVESVTKDAILDGRSKIEPHALAKALQARHAFRNKFRRQNER